MERLETVNKLNDWLKRLETWNDRDIKGDPHANVEVHLLYNEIKEFKHTLTARNIAEVEL